MRTHDMAGPRYYNNMDSTAHYDELRTVAATARAEVDAAEVALAVRRASAAAAGQVRKTPSWPEKSKGPTSAFCSCIPIS